MKKTERIKQLLPADGWWAVFADGENAPTFEESYYREKVVAFALVTVTGDIDNRHDPYEKVVPYIYDPEEGMSAIDGTWGGYAGIVHDSEWSEQRLRGLLEAHYAQARMDRQMRSVKEAAMRARAPQEERT